MKRPHGELWIDDDGKAHFRCHTYDQDFASTKADIIKFIEALQNQLDREAECPYYYVELNRPYLIKETVSG